MRSYLSSPRFIDRYENRDANDSKGHQIPMEPLFRAVSTSGHIKEQKSYSYQLDEVPQARNAPSSVARPRRRHRASAVGRRREVPMRLDVLFHYSGQNRCLCRTY
jgi:hypothetical protein